MEIKLSNDVTYINVIFVKKLINVWIYDFLRQGNGLVNWVKTVHFMAIFA